jgi:hypothetical protein
MILSFLALVSGCGAPRSSDPAPMPTVGKADSPDGMVRTGVSSVNARAGARYVAKRPVDALQTVGALTPLLKSILQRIASLGRPEFGVDALLFAEDPARYATFLPDERNAFPLLWRLLEVDDSLDVDPPGSFPLLGNLVTSVQPDPGKLDPEARVAITSLPTTLQTLAYRVVKSPGVPGDTVAFAEVVSALDNYKDYTSAEYFLFGVLLRAIEAALITPSQFPHLEYSNDPTQSADISVGAAKVTVSRVVAQEACGTLYNGASITTAVTLQFSIPSDGKLTWTPLSDSFLSTSNGGTTSVVSPGASSYGITGKDGRALALIELWQGGSRVAQQIAALPTSEVVGGESLAIVKNGAFQCLPFDAQFRDPSHYSGDLAEVVRLPPGRYQFPAGTYGNAVLNLYGMGVMRLDVESKSFWESQGPTPGTAVYEHCWELTALGPINMVTGASGAGPGFRFQFASGKIYFAEASYGVCFNGGALAATLTPSGRL